MRPSATLLCAALLAPHLPSFAAQAGAPAAAPAAAAAPAPISAFVDEDKYTIPRLSPDGKQLAITVRVPSGERTVPLIMVYSLPDMKQLGGIRLPLHEVPLDYDWVSNTRLEVNNTVAATRSVLDSLLFYRNQLGESDAADFTTAIEAVKRRNVSLGEFIDRFTRVVKMPAPELRPASLRAMADDILWLNREQCARNGIRLGWRRCDETPALLLDAGLMEGALLNIVKNAIEAVLAAQAAGRPGGHVELSLERRGAEAVLAVIDSADLLGEVPPRQLFTPFFSTKQGGQGIGLMFVREVLTRHGFPYALASTGQGETRFEIRFPAAP